MIKEFSYSFSELTVNQTEIADLLGYSDGQLPEPFEEYVFEAIRSSGNMKDIRGVISYENAACFPEENGFIDISDVRFNIGKTVAHELRNSQAVVLFICTAGKKISELAQKLLMGENPVLGYVYDVLGSLIVEAVADQLQQEIKEFAISSGELITNRYSPGYCQWTVADQQKLFSFFPDNCCGIGLTNSNLMLPIKSISGIIGIGPDVKFRQYTCDLCRQTDCFYRNRQKVL